MMPLPALTRNDVLRLITANPDMGLARVYKNGFGGVTLFNVDPHGYALTVQPNGVYFNGFFIKAEEG